MPKLTYKHLVSVSKLATYQSQVVEFPTKYMFALLCIHSILCYTVPYRAIQGHTAPYRAIQPRTRALGKVSIPYSPTVVSGLVD